MAKNIALVLITSIIVNFTGIWIKPQKAVAVDASDYMYLFWPTASDCSDKPSGWTVVSDGAGEAFYDATNGGLFPRGNSSYARNAGGALTHTHSGSGSQTGTTGSVTRSNSGSTQEINSHTHSVTVSTVDSISSLPKYGELCVIKYDNGIPSGDSAIPNGVVAMFASTPPSGWSDYSSTFSPGADTFVRGGTSSTGGSNSHQSTGHSVSGTLDATGSGAIAANGTTANLATDETHTHTFSGSSDTPDTQPPYREVYLGQKSSAGPIPNEMIAMFDDTDSSVGFSVAGWTRLSDSGGDFYQKFIKATGSYGTGGNTAHTHASISATSSTDGGTLGGKTGTGSNIDSHEHSVSASLADGANTNIPPYTDIVIAKKATVITALTTDSGSYPTSGETITVDSTVNNYHASTNLSSTKIDYVIFEDTGTVDGRPTAGETYVTNNCAGSGSWASGNYTHQTTGVNVNASSSANDQWTCSNSNFPNNTTYTLWARWWDGASYSYNIYFDKGSVTFSSIPTLGQIGFLILIGAIVFIGYRQGAIKLRQDKSKKQEQPTLSGRIGEETNTNNLT